MKSPYLKKNADFIGNFGRGYGPSSYHGARVTYLQKKVERNNKVNLKYKKK